MAYLSYRLNRKGGTDIRTAEGVRGHIGRVHKRGGLKAVLTRHVSLSELDAICAYVAAGKTKRSL